MLLAKLKTRGLSNDALSLMCSYLKNGKQGVVIRSSAGTRNKVVAVVP